MTPRRARIAVIALAALAVGAAALDGGEPDTETLRIEYVVTTDADQLLQPLVEQFNSETHRVGAREIEVVLVGRASGEAEAAYVAGTSRSPLWTPASSLWGRLLNHHVDAEWVVASESPSLVSSPQVIAIWEPLARALGWPRKKIGWRDLIALVRSERGWADFGLPDLGEFRLGHTNPDISTSGLSAIVSEYYAVTGKRAGLTLADVRRPEIRAAVREIERSIVHYGKTAEALTDQMDRYGLGYVHAVYTQETTVREFNEKRKHQATRLVPIPPADGTFVADYPLIVLRAPWVTADVREAAEAFAAWLPGRITQRAAARSGLRLRPPRGIVPLELPDAEVLAAVRDAWHQDRKPANIMLVVDSSRSMGEEGRLDAAKQALLSFVEKLSEEDRVALITSGARVRTNVELEAGGSNRVAVARAVRSLVPSGDRPVYPAIERALRDVRALGNADHINAVIVLSDGAGSDAGRERLLRAIAAQPVTEGTSVRIFAVAYGDDAAEAELRRIATASGGALFTAGDAGDIVDVYLDISAYF